MSTSPLALGAAGAAESGLQIETGSPDALCPELESTRAAVRRRLGELVVPGDGVFVAHYTIGHALAGSPRDFVRLELKAADGAVVLERELPLEGESCGTMSEVIALVLDRYFRALIGGDAPPPAAQPASPATPTTSTPPAHAIHAAVSPGAVSPGAVSPEAVSPEAVPASAVQGSTSLPAYATAVVGHEPHPREGGPAAAELEARSRHLDELALELAFRGLQRPTLGVRATLELLPQLYAGTALHLSLIQERETLLEGGEVKSRDAVWRAYVGWAWALEALRVYLGPGLRVGFERATGSGLEQGYTGLRASWYAGADAGAIWTVRNDWTLHVSGALDVQLPGAGGRFYVDDGEVLKPSSLRGWLGVGVGYDL